MRPLRVRHLCVVLLILLLSSSVVLAQNAPPRSNEGYGTPNNPSPSVTVPNRFSSFRFEAHFDFNWYGGVGAGGRLEFPIVPLGVLTNVDDEIALSLGAEVLYFYHPARPGWGVYPVAAAQWNFFLAPSVSIFPEAGLALLFGPSRNLYWGAVVAPFVGFGVRFHFNARNALLLRVTWPSGPQIGFTF